MSTQTVSCRTASSCRHAACSRLSSPPSGYRLLFALGRFRLMTSIGQSSLRLFPCHRSHTKLVLSSIACHRVVLSMDPIDYRHASRSSRMFAFFTTYFLHLLFKPQLSAARFLVPGMLLKAGALTGNPCRDPVPYIATGLAALLVLRTSPK
jgi:hypothetical protein